jgi:hypothetical protein
MPIRKANRHAQSKDPYLFFLTLTPSANLAAHKTVPAQRHRII